MTALRLVSRMKRDWMHMGRRPSGLCGAGRSLYMQPKPLKTIKKEESSILYFPVGPQNHYFIIDNILLGVKFMVLDIINSLTFKELLQFYLFNSRHALPQNKNHKPCSFSVSNFVQLLFFCQRFYFFVWSLHKGASTKSNSWVWSRSRTRGDTQIIF